MKNPPAAPAAGYVLGPDSDSECVLALDYVPAAHEPPRRLADPGKRSEAVMKLKKVRADSSPVKYVGQDKVSSTWGSG